jgi:hypothetical protein
MKPKENYRQSNYNESGLKSTLTGKNKIKSEANPQIPQTLTSKSVHELKIKIEKKK